MKNGLRHSLMDVRLHRALVILTIVVLPLTYLTKQALFNPQIEFLPPSFDAGWALHPVQEILHFQNGRASKDVEFARDFSLDALPKRLELRLRAFNSMRVHMNGREVFSLSDTRLWKMTHRIELTPYLRLGINELRIHVRNEGAIPALLVESPSFLTTPGEWKAALEPEFSDFQPVVPTLKRDPKPGPLQQWAGWTWAKPLIFVWLLGVALATVWTAVAHWLVPSLLPFLVKEKEKRRLHKEDEGADKRETPDGKLGIALRIAVPILIFGVSLWLNLSNTSRYPYSRAHFDWKGHVDYIQLVARTWKPPIASDGWMTYQPPLYYFAAAGVYRLFGGEDSPEWALKRVQYLDCLMGFALTLLAWLYARWAMPKNPPAQWIGLLFAAFLPMSLYMNPILTNEVPAGVAIAGTLYLLLRCLHPEGRAHDATASKHFVPSWKVAILGVASGLALLAKFTALFTCLVGAMALGLRALQRQERGDWSRLGVYLGAGIAVCGWYYIRNAQIFGDPFIGNWDVESGFHYEQNPSYRTVGFYTRFGGAFFHHPERSRWTTWLDGNYASMWSDIHTNFHSEQNTHAYFWLSVMLILAALPTAAIFLGLMRTGISAIRRPAWNPDLLLFAVPVLTGLSLVQFTMEIPTYSTVKAFFFLSLVPCLSVFLLRGRELFDLHLRSARWLMDGILIVMAGLSGWVYRFTP